MSYSNKLCRAGCIFGAYGAVPPVQDGNRQQLIPLSVKDYDRVPVAVIASDDVVDTLFQNACKARADCCHCGTGTGKWRDAVLDLLMIAKYFERIGDHATNIAEWVCYSLTGQHV